VQHFACHCTTGHARSEDDCLNLSCDSGRSHKVKLADLQARFTELAEPDANRRNSKPLVFLNACGSSVINPTAPATFPHFFLKNGNRGFIGTETAVPDGVASAFSRTFYSFFLRGCSLGEAIHQAKWELVERHRNPLGILYTVYADPELTVRRPAKQIL